MSKGFTGTTPDKTKQFYSILGDHIDDTMIQKWIDKGYLVCSPSSIAEIESITEYGHGCDSPMHLEDKENINPMSLMNHPEFGEPSLKTAEPQTISISNVAGSGVHSKSQNIFTSDGYSVAPKSHKKQNYYKKKLGGKRINKKSRKKSKSASKHKSQRRRASKSKRRNISKSKRRSGKSKKV
mgnify:CR=1 FL=1